MAQPAKKSPKKKPRKKYDRLKYAGKTAEASAALERVKERAAEYDFDGAAKKLTFKKIGRPTLFQPRYVEIAFEHAASGGIDEQLAIKFGVSVNCIYEWKHAHPAFGEALRLGKLGIDASVEKKLYEKTQGAIYTDQVAIKLKDVEYDDSGKKVAERERVQLVDIEKHLPPDTTAQIFWLKNRRSHEWRDQQNVVVDAKVEIVDPSAALNERLNSMRARITIDHEP